jgi:serine/threonine-protein kinase
MVLASCSSDAPRPDGPTTAAPAPATSRPRGAYFPAGSVFEQDVSAMPARADSAATIAWLDAAGGWGGGRLQIDFSMEVLAADASTPMRAFTATDDFYTPDCDAVPVPVPAAGAVEGERGYACEQDGDCHLLVRHAPTRKLYEMWRADLRDDFRGGCLVVWDLDRVYGAEGRGAQCTSADAAGLPIAPLLFTADEVAAGAIDHAVRFILPNERIRNGVYVAPATHSTSATSGGGAAPPYGAWLRLRADYPIDALPAGAQVVARALARHGMILADGGTIALTAQSDRFTTAKWDGLLGPRDLAGVPVTAFEVVDMGEPVPYTGDCRRLP